MCSILYMYILYEQLGLSPARTASWVSLFSAKETTVHARIQEVLSDNVFSFSFFKLMREAG